MGFLAIIRVPPKAKKKKTGYKKPEPQAKAKSPGFGDSGEKGSNGAQSPDDDAFRIYCKTYPDLEKFLYVKDISTKYTTRLPTHPLETGMVKHDHKIIEPREYTANAYVKATALESGGETKVGICRECAAILDELVESKDIKNDFIMIDSPMEWTSPQLYLSSYEKRTESDKTDVFSFTLHLQELLIAKSETQVSENPDIAGKSSKGGKGQGKAG